MIFVLTCYTYIIVGYAGWLERIRRQNRSPERVTTYEKLTEPNFLFHAFLGAYVINWVFMFFFSAAGLGAIAFFLINIPVLIYSYFLLRINLDRILLSMSKWYTKIAIAFLSIPYALLGTSEVSSHLARLTTIPTTSFGGYELAVGALTTSVLWIFTLQFIIGFFTLYTFNNVDKVDMKKNRLFSQRIFMQLGTLSTLMVVTLPVISKFLLASFIPWVIDKTFVTLMYHPNTDTKGHIICTYHELSPKTEISLMPNNEVSIAIRPDEDSDYEFYIRPCLNPRRHVSNQSSDHNLQ